MNIIKYIYYNDRQVYISLYYLIIIIYIYTQKIQTSLSMILFHPFFHFIIHLLFSFFYYYNYKLATTDKMSQYVFTLCGDENIDGSKAFKTFSTSPSVQSSLKQRIQLDNWREGDETPIPPPEKPSKSGSISTSTVLGRGIIVFSLFLASLYPLL